MENPPLPQIGQGNKKGRKTAWLFVEMTEWDWKWRRLRFKTLKGNMDKLRPVDNG